MSNYSKNIIKAAAQRAADQIDFTDYDVFEELYGNSVDDLDFNDFSFGHNEDYWNVVANILEGNVALLDGVEDMEDYGRYLFENERWSVDVEEYFDFDKYGEDLRDRVDEDELIQLSCDPTDKDADLAESYIDAMGGIDNLFDSDYEQYVDFKMLGEARENPEDLVICDGKYYNVERFDDTLGQKLEKEMAEEVSKEKQRKGQEKDER